MRISTLELHRQGVAGILDNQSRLSRTQLQIASGRRLLTPADDPAAAVEALNLTDLRGRLDQFNRNAVMARTRNEMEETVLTQVSDVLLRVRELAVRGLNDSLAPADRNAIALEVRERLADLLAAANARDQNGDWLFAGFYRGAAEPFADAGSGNYTYAGDEGRRLIQIGAGRRVADGDPGTEVFMRIPTGSGVKNLFAIVEGLADDLEAAAPNPGVLDELDAALERIGALRAGIGARLNAIADQVGAHDSLRLELEGTLSGLADLDYAEAVARLNREMAGLQAAQQVYVRLANLSLFNYL